MSATILAHAPVASDTTAVTRWTGRILTGIGALFMAFDAGVKIVGAKVAIEGSVQLGFAAEVVPKLGLVQAACLILYLVPRTATLGAVLLTAYLGGAVETHVRLGNPVLTHMLSPVYVAAILWGGLYLRDRRVRDAVGPTR